VNFQASLCPSTNAKLHGQYGRNIHFTYLFRTNEDSVVYKLVCHPMLRCWWASGVLGDAPIEFQIYGGGFQAGVSSSSPGWHIKGDRRLCISPVYLREC